MKEDLKLKWDIYTRRLASSGWDELLEKGMECVKVVSEAVEKPTPGSVARAAMSVARTLTAGDMYYREALDPRVWQPMFPFCVRDQLFEILEPMVTSKVKVSNAGTAYFVTQNNVRIGWVKDGDQQEIGTEILAHEACYEGSVEFARNLLWKSVDASRIVLTGAGLPQAGGAKQGYRTQPTSNHGQLRVATDDLVLPVSSKFSVDYAPYLKRCLDHKVNRTILFYGPPGSGKSTIARTLCDILKLRSLRVRVEDLGSLGSEPIIEMIRIFEPDVIIFDDLDRAMSQVALLETLETLHKRVSFVFATVNDVESLQPALVRPGRFDELIEIVNLDKEAVLKALGEYSDAFDTVKDWPVAFISEYVVRRRLLGKEKAVDAVADLKKRVERLMNGGGLSSLGPDAPDEET